MEKKQILNILVPSVAAIAVVGLIALVIGLDAKETNPTGKSEGATGTPPFPLDAPEWKDIGGGLKVWDVKEGAGTPVEPGTQVTAHYTGWLTNGFSFDASRKHGTSPTPFSLNRVVEGWQKGIPGMKPGGVRRLYIPYRMAYGETGSPPDIPPRSDLLFEVELVSSP